MKRSKKWIIGIVAGLVAIMARIGSCANESSLDLPATAASPTAPIAASIVTPEPTAMQTPTSLVWRQFTPAQISEIDEGMDEYIDREHAGVVNYADDAEMRYNVCTAMAGVNWDWDLFVEAGDSLVLQGAMFIEDWLLIRDLAGYLMYLVQQPTRDAYMQSRRAGETTIPPMPAMGKAYCAYNLFKP